MNMLNSETWMQVALDAAASMQGLPIPAERTNHLDRILRTIWLTTMGSVPMKVGRWPFSSEPIWTTPPSHDVLAALAGASMAVRPAQPPNWLDQVVTTLRLGASQRAEALALELQREGDLAKGGGETRRLAPTDPPATEPSRPHHASLDEAQQPPSPIYILSDGEEMELKLQHQSRKKQADPVASPTTSMTSVGNNDIGMETSTVAASSLHEKVKTTTVSREVELKETTIPAISWPSIPERSPGTAPAAHVYTIATTACAATSRHKTPKTASPNLSAPAPAAMRKARKRRRGSKIELFDARWNVAPAKWTGGDPGRRLPPRLTKMIKERIARKPIELHQKIYYEGGCEWAVTICPTGTVCVKLKKCPTTPSSGSGKQANRRLREEVRLQPEENWV